MKIKALSDFQDGNILAFIVQAGQVIEVNARENELIAQSGGHFMPMPDDAELTPIVELNTITTAPETKEQLEARHLLERQKLEAKQKEEVQKFDANEKTARVVNEKRDLHLTDNDGKPQATREVEEKVSKKVAEKQAKETQKDFDRFAKEAEAEVKNSEDGPKTEKPILVDKKVK